jgi:uroporphyrinogen-III synthase
MIRLAVMRPREKLDESIRLAREKGFEPVCASPLEIRTNDDGQFDHFLAALEAQKVDTIVLTSSTGVAAMLELADRRMSRDYFLAFLARTSIIAIGPLTAQALRAANLAVAAMPEEHSSQGIVAMLSGEAKGKHIFVLRSDHGEPVLVTGLQEKGAAVNEVVVYRLIVIDTEALDRLVEESLSERIDAYAFTSSLSAQTFIEAAEKHSSREVVLAILRRATVGAMGPPTREKLESMGVRVDVVPRSATFGDMLSAISAGMKY